MFQSLFRSKERDQQEIIPPRVPKEIVEYLERVFPIEQFKLIISERQLATYQGAHEVIDLLRALHSADRGEADVLQHPEGTGA